jgi:uncharacterized membrane protein
MRAHLLTALVAGTLFMAGFVTATVIALAAGVA